MVDWAMHARQGYMSERNNTFPNRQPATDTDSTRGILNGHQPVPPEEVHVAKVIVNAATLKSSG